MGQVVNLLTKNIESDAPILTVMIGAPASGKSIYSRNMVKYYRRGRVNQDDIRNMIKGGDYEFTNKTEKIIKEINDKTIEVLLDNGFDCVVDNTHCNPTTLNKLLEKFKDKALIHILIFEVPLWKLKVRNVLRYIKTFGKTWIPPHVIENMHDKIPFIKITLKSLGYEYTIIK